LPHSEIPGSTIARISPGLIAACHVLLRLSTPRHSPDALLYLSITPHQRPARMAFLVGYRPLACSSPVARIRPRLRLVPTMEHPDPSLLQSPSSAIGESTAEYHHKTLSIPCVPIRTTGQHLRLSYENRTSCPTARRSHSQGKHHTMTNSIPDKADALLENHRRGSGFAPAPGPWSTSSQNIS
jgi:hypothetical protein